MPTLFVLAGQALVLWWLGTHLPTWEDEEFTLASTAHGVIYALHRAISYELQPPAYFVLVAALRAFDPSIVLVRAISALFAIGTTAVCAILAQRFVARRNIWLFTLLVASNPFVIFVGTEMRVYAMALCESALLFLFFDRGFLFGRSSRARAGFFFVALFGVYTQYFVAFDVLACCIALLVLRRFADFCVCGALSVAAVAALAPIALSIPNAASQTLGTQTEVHGELRAVFKSVFFPIMPNFASFLSEKAQTIAERIAKLATLAIIVIGRPRIAPAVVVSGAVAGAVYLCYAGVQFATQGALIIPRHFVALAVPEAFFALALCAAFSANRGRAWTIALVTVVGIVNVSALATTTVQLTKPGDAARVGTYLSSKVRPGDAIAVYLSESSSAISRYYNGRATVYGYPHATDAVHFDADASVVRSEAAANAAFAALPASARLWFVDEVVCDRANRYGCREVERAIRARYQTASVKQFFKTSVIELVPKASAPDAVGLPAEVQ